MGIFVANENDTTSGAPTLLEAGINRSHAIDVLRALAALAVVAYHSRAEFWVGFRDTYSMHGIRTIRPDVWLSYGSGIFSLGWLGVPIFFVLSGYCIHLGFATKLSTAPATKLDLLTFYKRRFLRIYPVYVAAMLLTALVDYFAQTGQLPAAWINANLSTFLLNLLMTQELLVSTFGSNGVFWTLSIEFHLYLFYPVLFLIFRRYGPGRALAVAAGISMLTGCAYWAFDLSRIFVHARGGSPLFTSHLFLWTAGAYLAEIKVGRAPALRGPIWHLAWIAALVVGVILQQRGVFAWSPLFLAIGAAGLVGVAIPAIGYLCRRDTIGVRAFYLIGVASYSLYATHVPIFHAIQAATSNYRSGSILWACACSGIAIAFSLLFFHLVERYTIRAPSTRRRDGLTLERPSASHVQSQPAE